MKRVALIGLALAGCTQTPPPQAATVAPTEGCRTQAVADLIGKPLTGTLQADAQRRTGANTVRVLAPDTAATMDYRPDRMNILVDSRGVINGFRCG